MYLPEWEIEELLSHNPQLLGFPSKKLKLVERQKYLEKSGGYVDLLFKKGDVYLIVEIKSTLVNDKTVISNQLIPYKKSLAIELDIPEDEIVCMLITPNGFSEDVERLCQETGIITRTLDQNKLVNAIRKKNLKTQHPNKESFVKVESESASLMMDIQDDRAKRELARLFIEISGNAPIRAHEVGSESSGELNTNRDMWFWLFYSVMDRRANAVTFVKAKEALEKEKVFAPYRLVELARSKGERRALNKVAKILENSNFPLMSDRVMGKLSFPKSILDAAKFISKYGYDFEQLYKEYTQANRDNLIKARDSIWRDLQKNIYGAGPRIASQVIRGLVLKGSWKFPLDHNRFLEKCRFNVWIGGPTRLSLTTRETEYYKQLGEFAERFLNGNRGIIAHVLWYIRKRYCKRPPKCDECMVADHCGYSSFSIYKSHTE